MAGGKKFWIEVETVSPNNTTMKNGGGNPDKGGMRSKTAVSFSGKKARLVGKQNLKIVNNA